MRAVGVSLTAAAVVVLAGAVAAAVVYAAAALELLRFALFALGGGA